MLQDIFMSDESDNDDALDEEWEPSDCEPDAEEAKEHRQAEPGAATGTLVAEFYKYLTDVDGGYRSVKVAQQYKCQVQSIIRTCKMKLYVLIEMYIRTVRSQLVATDSEVQQVFISSNGLSLTSFQDSYSVFRTFQKEGVQVKGRTCATTFRKSLATGMQTHMPGQKDHLAALAQHKPQTKANYYHVHDKVSQTDLGRRAVKNLVSLKTKQDLKDTKENVSTPVSWSDKEPEEMKMFKTELETGVIEEGAV